MIRGEEIDRKNREKLQRKRNYKQKTAQLSFYDNEDGETSEKEEKNEIKEIPAEDSDEYDDKNYGNSFFIFFLNNMIKGDKLTKRRNFGKNPAIDTSFLPVLAQ